MPNTILGVPGNLIDCFSEETCSVTKVGGSLWLPKEISTQFQLEKFQCCDIALSLIFQCHVPVLGKKRWLLVLGCTKCNNTWKVFRIQYDQTTPKNNTQIDSNQKQNQFVQKTDQNLLFQNIIVEESKQNQSGMDLSDLNSELDKLLSLKKNKQQTSIKTNKNSKQSLKIEKNEMEEIDEIELGPKIPSFYIHAIDEPQKDALNAKEKQHIDQLIKEYEQKETDEEREDSNNQNDNNSGKKNKKPNHKSNSSNNRNQNTDPPEQGEKYEKEALENVDQPMLKFLKRVNRSPQQCARYAFDGQCIWPTQIKSKNIPKCAICQQDRVFELQLMSPLISCLQESCEWLNDGDETNKQLINVGQEAVEKWQWLTMGCYVCGKNCQVEGKICYEEFVMVFNE
eukprot:TRINITY_DN6055_c0_g1_i2.p1 TRINITY_DN6055_c0_g1~~TRINITY_DN6055_c0_g1_i2.p1  ORF type:complete len:397 (-),score=59.78 TRINITY_DN6055_c0_g1_i2:68-1258(-)